jgi:hypothetical protein
MELVVTADDGIALEIQEPRKHAFNSSIQTRCGARFLLPLDSNHVYEEK